MSDPTTLGQVLTEFGAAIGSASGLTSLGMVIKQIRDDRPKLYVEASVDLYIPEPHRLRAPLVDEWPAASIQVHVYNGGRRELYVRQIGGELSNGARFVFEVPDLPYSLKAGEPRQFVVGADIFGSDPRPTSIHAIDGSGRPWELSQPAFLKLERDARAALKKLADDAEAKQKRFAADMRADEERIAREIAARLARKKDEGDAKQ